jgi:hypothetical protein
VEVQAMKIGPQADEYAPYHTLKAFQEGYDAYLKANWSSPHDPDSVDAQAWDRGHEYAMRLARYENQRGIQ